MALPIRPGQGLPTSRPVTSAAQEAAPAEQGLPSLPVLPEIPKPQAEAPKPRQRPAPRPEPTPEPVAKKAPAPRREAPQAKPELPEGWAIDPVTGKKFKKLPGFKEGVMRSQAAIKKAANGGMTLEQLRMTVIEEPDFDLDNLNGSAETFLAHLRVPPNKEEQRKLREEREAREKLYEEAARRAAAEQAEEEKDSL